MTKVVVTDHIDLSIQHSIPILNEQAHDIVVLTT